MRRAEEENGGGLKQAEAALARVRVIRKSAERWGELASCNEEDMVAAETPIAFKINGAAYAVMLASPTDLIDFVTGFLLTEGIIKKPEEILSCDVMLRQNGPGITVRTEILAERFANFPGKERLRVGLSGCGLCGVENIGQVLQKPPKLKEKPSWDLKLLLPGMEKMQALQTVYQACGSVHAAAGMSLTGEISEIREDVGRHNALDKLIGALARKKQNFSHTAILVSSRAGYEIVQKAAAVGISLVAAVSGATDLAISYAEESGITLAGFVRSDHFTIYTKNQE